MVVGLDMTGTDLEALCACFPKFPKEEIEKIYYEVKNKPEDSTDSNVMSVNCS